MVRHGVGVVLVAVALAGCGGSSTSDEDEVVAIARQLSPAAERHDGRAICREILHPNTVQAIERLTGAQTPPGGPRASCEQKYRSSQAYEEAIVGPPPKAADVTIAGDVAYVPDGRAKRGFARRVGGTWKVDFTADAAIRWAMRASFACVEWRDRLQALPLPTANRQGIVDALHRRAGTMASFVSALDADAAPGAEQAPARDLAASLERLNFQLEGAATALRRGGTLEAAATRAAKATNAEVRGILTTANAANVECGRIPGIAPDGADFRRQANAICTPIAKSIERLPDPGSSATAAVRFLRRASALERRASRRLVALEPPADLDRVYRATIATLSKLSDTLRSESAAVSRRDLAGARRAVAKLGPLDYRKSSGFSRLGVVGCARL